MPRLNRNLNAQTGHRAGTSLLGRVGVLIGCALWIGCATQSVKLRETPHSPLVERLKLTAKGGPQASERTYQLLRHYDLEKRNNRDPDGALEELTKVSQREPCAEMSYALAELNFLRAVQIELIDRQTALERYWNTVAHSYSFLFDSETCRDRNFYDPQFRGACDLYNGALERCLRMAKNQDLFLPGKRLGIETSGGKFQIDIVAKGFKWNAADFDSFEFVSDYAVAGLTNQYNTYGLGVPLVAVRRKSDSPGPDDRYYPQRLSFPMTAFLRLHPTPPGEKPTCHCELELIDPLEMTKLEVAGVEVPLESDLSTPLAFFLNNTQLAGQDTFGFLHPERAREMAGLYMLQPYQPGKIPVLMVHGLWSSPMTWMEMFNDLNSMPEIRDNYQFWFYLYPTGQPFLLSAAELREDLAAMRKVFDPEGCEPALDQMVMVGHSMGGLVSKLQTIDSGNDYWNVVSAKPFEQVKAETEFKNKLSNAFFFDANPSVRRVVTLGTPHRGSNFSNDFTRWLGRKLVQLPRFAMQAPRQLLMDNPDLFRSAQYAEPKTSLDNLSPKSPLLPVILASHKPPEVHYHNVVGVLKKPAWGQAKGDGIVPFSSSHLDDVESEIVVDADHGHVHTHPLAVLEVRRILLEHLRQLRAYDPPGVGEVRVVPYYEP